MSHTFIISMSIEKVGDTTYLIHMDYLKCTSKSMPYRKHI